ncbi:DEAD/DEAH box helicase [Risungbinella massiliensis]|uniref:DEAD/DEAH box helicase n=1 Tax=Risungbinella massiliensis TaxID=1329796 RepID=UPI000A69AAF8|nr:DEAD/DEAH box helicase [Risungbinella massiliensis]
MVRFADLGLSEEVLQSMEKMGFEEATPIQAQTIPLALAGKDLLGQAQTGTGKTAAFGIPLVEKIAVDDGHVQGLIITPTRELAVQVAEELNRIGQVKKVRTLPVYGGQEIDRQIRSLKKRPHIVVGTPGRLQDHIRRRTIRLQTVEMVILDEADEMLNMGFIEDIEAILTEVPTSRQTLLFSATMPKQIQALAEKFMTEPANVKIQAKQVTMPNIEQYFMEVAPKQKFDVLCNLLDIQSPELAIVFGRTKKGVDEITEGLRKRGYSAEGLHGDLTQAKRDQVVRRLKSGSIDIMVATDVAARGLDISGITHVYNYDIPQDPESYVHRIGRTGRAGKHGVAMTFVHSREMNHLKLIERVTKSKIKREAVPTIAEALHGSQQTAVNQLLEVVQEGQVDTYHQIAKNLLEQHDSVTLLSAALKIMTKEPDTTPVELSQHFVMDRGSRSGGRRDGGRGRGDGRFGKGGGKKRFDKKEKSSFKRDNSGRKNGPKKSKQRVGQ